MSYILKAPKGAKIKRVKGRGDSAGQGSTCGRGNNGQNSRSGGNVRTGFEGGQMPLYRRVARRGFSNYMFKVNYHSINLDELEKRFNDGDQVDSEALKAKGLLSGKATKVKILGRGEITKKITLNVEKVSANAKEKIEKAGGKVVE
ncbi:MAG: 50S ribosomal protein L15 [Spirochaetales bacterium]|nr:50S ribosomal protein L15 [Spirochaetales bacterium]